MFVAVYAGIVMLQKTAFGSPFMPAPLGSMYRCIPEYKMRPKIAELSSQISTKSKTRTPFLLEPCLQVIVLDVTNQLRLKQL